jgi:four helix bundle protein
MPQVKRFEDLRAWTESRVLATRVFQACRGATLRREFALGDQLRRSALSVVSNIAEGFDRFRPSEFARFLVYAKGSCAELRAQLYVARDIDAINENEFAQLKSEAEEVARLVGKLRTAVASRVPKKG